MTLKSAILGRAEDLPKDIREKYNLPDSGLIIIEALNPDLRENIISIEDIGLSGYLKGLGSFNDVEVAEN